MDKKEPYIRQLTEGESLYTKLQQQTLEEIQRLSGKVWTDYNAHNPGVTLADIANHALTELDYKLGFDLVDYCVAEGGVFEPKRYGLFPPEDVYTTSPVTADDYRRLFVTQVHGIDNVWVECDTKTGGYTVKAVLSPFGTEEEKAVCKQIEDVYQRYRNLCEYLSGEVVILKPDELEFYAEFEIESGEDASTVLARVYQTILRYMLGTVRISTPGEERESGISPEDWLEGAVDAVHAIIPELRHTEYELYRQLREVEGIRSFSTCYLMKGGEPQTDFSQGFSLKIPERMEELHVCIRQGRFEVETDIQTFRTQLESLYRASRPTGGQGGNWKNYNWRIPEATYRDIFTHDSIVSDFPACYRLLENSDASICFETYLKLYDKVIQDGLWEVEELPHILSLEGENVGDLTLRRIRMLKKRYLDFLDKLYGVESHPAWLSEQNCYGETEEGTLRRRMSFLHRAAYLTGNRFRARNIALLNGIGNTPVVKEWFCLLLGIESSDEHTVSNVLPKQNLQIVEKRADKPLIDRIDSLLIDERMLEADKVEKVDYEELAAGEAEKREEYKQMSSELHFFNVNRISGDLFRGGTDLENYRIVQVGAGEYMLIYHNKEHSGWINLGYTYSRKRTNMLANILRRFLRELNRACETVYIVEPVLVDSNRPFQLMVVLPAWTYRFYTPRFREKCRELLRSLLPAHLSGKIYWLNERSMRSFENCYHQLMRALTDSRIGDYKKLLLTAMDELLETAVEKQDLDDTD